MPRRTEDSRKEALNDELALLEESLFEKDRTIAELREELLKRSDEIQQRETQLKTLHDAKQEFERLALEENYELSADLSQTEDKLKAAQKSYDQLFTQLELQKKVAQEQENAMDKLISKIKNSETLVSTLHKEIARLKKENIQDQKLSESIAAGNNETQQNAIKALELKIRELDAGLVDLREKHAEELKAQEAELKLQISALTKEEDALRQQLNDVREIADAQQKRLEEQEAEIYQLSINNGVPLSQELEADRISKELARRSEALSAEIRDLGNTVKQKETQLTVAKKEVETLGSQLKTATTYLSQAEAKVAELQGYITALTDAHAKELADQEKLIAGLREEIQLISREKDGATAKAERAEQEKAVVTAELQTLRQENEQLKARVGELDASEAELKADLTALRKTLVAKEGVLETAVQAIEDLNAQLRAAKEGLSAAQADLSALRTENAQLKTRAERAEGNSEQQAAQIKTLEATIRENERKLQADGKEIAKLTKLLDKANRTLSAAEETITSLRQENKQLKDSAKDFAKEKTKLLDMITALEATVRESEEALEAAEQENTTLNEQLAATKGLLSTAQDDLASLQKEMAALVQEHKQAIQELTAHLIRERDLNATLRQEIEATRREKRLSDEQAAAAKLEKEAALEALAASEAESHRLQTQLDAALAKIAGFETHEADDGVDTEHSDYSDTLSPDDEEESGDLFTQPHGEDDDLAVPEAIHEEEPDARGFVAADDPVVAPPLPSTAARRPTARDEHREDAPRPKAAASWDSFLQHGGVMATHFKDTLVRDGEEEAIEGPADIDRLAVSRAGGTEPEFELVKLKEGDCIHSTAKFGGGATGKLVQDHTGKVVNRTTDRLTEGQQVIMALRQAEMTLNNFKPTGKDDDAIVISGNESNAAQGRKLVAALLLLKNHPDHREKMKGIEIISKVPGCEVPKPANRRLSLITGKETQDEANQKFIAKFLPATPDVSEDRKERLQDQVGQFAKGKTAYFDRVHTMKKALHEGRETMSTAERQAKTQELEDATLKPGDRIDIRGDKTPRG